MRVFTWAMAAGFGAAAFVGAWWVREAAGLILVAGALLAAIASLAAVGLGRTRVTVGADGIEYVQWKRPLRLRSEEILGYRTGSWISFEPRGGGRKVRVPLMGTMDRDFHAWLGRFPDLDAAERARSEEQLLRERALGGSPAERKAAIGRSRSFARALTVVSVCTIPWVVFFPRPYAWAVAAAFAMPVLAVGAMLLRPGVFQLLGAQNDARAHLVVPFFLPGLAGTIRAFDFDLLFPSEIVLPALAGGALLGGAAVLADRAARAKPAWLLVLVPWLAVQAGGGLTVLNCFRDPSLPERYEAKVLGKRETKGKGASWKLDLGPWGPREETTSTSVSPVLFDRVNAGDEVLVLVRQGRLGIRWFRVVRC